MASTKSLVSLALIALIFFSISLATTSAAGCGGASNSLTGNLRRNVLQTAAVGDTAESSLDGKMNVHIKRVRFNRPVTTGGRRSAANRITGPFFGVGSMLSIFVFLGFFL